MTKTKNSLRPTPNTIRNRRAALAAGLLLAPAAIVGSHIARTGNADAGVPKAELIHDGVAKLQSYQAKHPNILSVAPDTDHPGLERVTYTFTPGHNTMSHLAAEVAPGQIRDDADADIAGYNDGSDITHFGQKIAVDVDPTTGFIVPNPDLPPSAEGEG